MLDKELEELLMRWYTSANGYIQLQNQGLDFAQLFLRGTRNETNSAVGRRKDKAIK